MEYSVVVECWCMCFVYVDIIKDFLVNCVIQDDLESRDCSYMVLVEKICVESVELVLFFYVNYQGNIFGGQIMVWMENVVIIVVSWFCCVYFMLKVIEMFYF